MSAPLIYLILTKEAEVPEKGTEAFERWLRKVYGQTGSSEAAGRIAGRLARLSRAGGPAGKQLNPETVRRALKAELALQEIPSYVASRQLGDAGLRALAEYGKKLRREQEKFRRARMASRFGLK